LPKGESWKNEQGKKGKLGHVSFYHGSADYCRDFK
jgi:hypothetical protein